MFCCRSISRNREVRTGSGSGRAHESVKRISIAEMQRRNKIMIKNITTQTKIYIVIAAVFVALIVGAAAWSNYRIRSLENRVESVKRSADRSQQAAIEKETEAEVYKQKIAYLERLLGETGQLARKQDEKLEKLNSDSRRARGDVDRARRTSAVPTNAVELCEKLAGLGHPCTR